MAQKFSDAARAELVAGINSSDVSFTIVAGGSLFPAANTGASAISNSADWFKLVLQDVDGIEIVYVRTHVADSLSFSNILRGQEGTTAKEFLAGSIVGLRPLASDAANVVRLGDVRDTAITLALAADPSWLQLADMPAVIAAGADAVTARTAIGLGSVDNTSDAGKPVSTAQQTALNLKVDTVAGKGLSTEDYSTADMTKLAGVAEGATAYTHPVTHTASIITQDASNRFVTDAEKATWTAKQAALVSGTNIKTINGASILGSGDMTLGAGTTLTYTYTGVLSAPPIALPGTTEMVLASPTGKERVNGLLLSGANVSLTGIEFSELEFVGGTFSPINLNALTSLSLPLLTSVGGSFSPNYMAALTSLSFPALTSVGGSFSPYSMNALTSLSAPALTTVGGSFGPYSMNALTSLSLPLLTSVGGSFSPSALNALTSLSFPALTSVGAGITLTSSTAALTTLDIGASLKVCNGNVNITSAALNQASVDSILIRLAALDGTNGTTAFNNRTVTITGTSSPPSADGLAAKAVLVARGCTVTHK